MPHRNREPLEIPKNHESEEIEIRFHDGYSDYDDEIKEINKSKRFSIIAISLSILLILLLQ